MEPVICNPQEPYALCEEDLLEIYNQYEILSKEMLNPEEKGNGFTFYHYMLDLSEGPCVQKRISGCGSGTEYLAITPWGRYFLVISLLGKKNIVWGISGMALQKQRYSLNLRRIIAIQNRNVRNVGHSFTVVAVVQLIQYMQRVLLREHMSSAVKSSARE